MRPLLRLLQCRPTRRRNTSPDGFGGSSSISVLTKRSDPGSPPHKNGLSSLLFQSSKLTRSFLSWRTSLRAVSGPEPAALVLISFDCFERRMSNTENALTPARPRDKNGVLLPKQCHRYGAGHVVHWIAGNGSAGAHHLKGVLLSANGYIITVDFGTETRQYRNHDPERLIEIVKIGGRVAVCEEWVIMRSRSGFVFSLADPESPWSRCQ
jgi:hypothetical protein